MSKVVRYDKNPFIENMVVPIRGQAVRLSQLGKDDNILVNQATGEVQGTHVTTYRRVDAEQFVKLFTANIALTFDLKAAGIKAFNVLLWCLQNRAVERDLIPLDKIVLDEFLAEHSDRKPPIKLSQPTFWRGLAELEKAQIIAKHLRQGWYYINPNFAFNGNRIAFTTVIERQQPKSKTEGDAHLQQPLPISTNEGESND
ncbi:MULTISPECIES: replication/maintenance protein RepL [Bacteria]|uniref:replication/maintenance protein RepL n=1 Tax=Bacteria TaxID=2 RepID=UPI0018689184|nr:replication/maintenance protein RepL [Halomonas sp. 3A7M]